MEKGVQLYKDGYAPYLLLSNGSVENLYKRALELGVPNDSILMEVKSDITLDNAVFSKEIMMVQQLESALVVSSNSHMRRVKVLYDKTFRNSDIRLTYVAGEMDAYNPNRWWEEETNRNTTLRE